MGSILCIYYIIITSLIVLLSIVRVKGNVLSRATSIILLIALLTTLFTYKKTEGFLDKEERTIYMVSGHGHPLVDVYSKVPENGLVYPLIDSKCNPECCEFGKGTGQSCSNGCVCK